MNILGAATAAGIAVASVGLGLGGSGNADHFLGGAQPSGATSSVSVATAPKVATLTATRDRELGASLRAADHAGERALTFELPSGVPPGTDRVVLVVDGAIVLEVTGYLGGGFGWIVDEAVGDVATVTVSARGRDRSVLARTTSSVSFR